MKRSKRLYEEMAIADDNKQLLFTELQESYGITYADMDRLDEVDIADHIASERYFRYIYSPPWIDRLRSLVRR